jgi:hypothetical protein
MFSKLCSLTLMASAAQAELTSNHGQFHHHNPDKNVKRVNADKPLEVHIIPHSHDDVGWLKTVEEYYEGWKQDIAQTTVRNTITTVFNQLLQDPTKKFSQVEMKFFSMWWDE